jgi:hypothetical protein
MRKFLSFMFLLVAMIMGMNSISADEIDTGALTLIEQGKYYDLVMQKIDAAQESIFMLMPEITFVSTAINSKVTALMQALVRAKRRGVFVFVLLNLDDDRTHKPQSLDAFFFLNDNGIDVHFDELAETLATRFLVFDRKELMVGSTLWNDRALEQSNQVDMYFASEPFSKRLIDLVLKIDIFDNPLELEYYDQLYISSDFIEHPNGMKAFADRNDPDALAAYLYLLKEYSESNQPEFIVVNAQAMVTALQIDKGRVNTGSLQKARGLLERLQETYVLIGFKQITADNDFNVFFYNLTDSSKLILPFCKDIRVSANYFETGAFKTLNVIDQYVYFYLLLLESRSGYGTWFKVTYDDFKMLPGFRETDYPEAVRILRRENLIATVYRGDKAVVNTEHNPFSCLIKKPIFKEWSDNKIDELVKQYSGRLVKQAIGVARELLLDKDIESIERLILVIKQYTHIKVKKVVIDELQPLQPEDPRKTLDSLLQLLKEKHPEIKQA